MSDQIQVSTFTAAFSTEPQDYAAETIVEVIRTGGKKIRDQVQELRDALQRELAAHGDIKRAKLATGGLKQQFPGVTWSGTFSNRANDALVAHSGLLCADLDSLNGTLDDVRGKLEKSPYVWVLFSSPGGDGLKAVFRVYPDAAKHLGSYRAIERHVRELTGVQIDEKCKDTARLCFLSYDPELVHNEDAIAIEPLPEPEKRRPVNNGTVDLSERQRIATGLLGTIDWESDASGYVTCPGKGCHTNPDGKRDCRVYLDGAPTLHCVHNSCSGLLEAVNGELRSRIGRAEFKPDKVRAESQTKTATIQPPGEMVTPRPLGELLEAIEGILRRYVVFPSQEQATAVALWVAHTWTIDAFDFTPYLHVFSAEKRSGKSRLLDVLELLVKAPWRDAGATEAVLFRKIERDKPTLLSDEIDTVFHTKKNDGMENIRRMFNLGFTRGNKVSRCVGQNTSFDIQEFDPFCPKVLCGIGRCLPDTVSDRALAIELIRQSTEEKAERFRARDARELVSDIRAELQAWAEQPGLIDKLKAARPHAPAEIRDRQEEICEPLIAIADLAGGNWPEIGRTSLVSLCAQEEDASTGVKLLGDIKHVFDEAGTDRLTTRSIIEGLAAIEDDRPWALWFEDALRNDKLKAAAARLARRLKGFKVKPCKIRLGDETAQGYHRADFQNAWKRYLPAAAPPSRIDGTNGTNGTNPQSTRENHVPTSVQSTRNVPTSVSTTRNTFYQGETQNVPSVPSVPSNLKGERSPIATANNSAQGGTGDHLITEAMRLFDATPATAA
jgi:hypothetical protein